MNPNIKARWIEALRSGKYQQGKNHLVTENGERCCLGVLCELAAEEGVVTRARAPQLGFVRLDSDSGFAYNTTLPMVVARWAGLSFDNPTLIPPKSASEFSPDDEDTFGTTVADANDSGDYTFDGIADLIERNL